jgi:hypothetical protein
MVTDGGPHPPEMWAEATADQIIDISAQAPESKLQEAREFRTKLVTILTGHHDMVQQHERGKLVERGAAHLTTEIDPSQHVDDPVADVVAASRGYSFEAHFAKPEVQDYLRQTIGNHFATAIHIERSWHADADPEHEASVAFRAAHHPGE